MDPPTTTSIKPSAAAASAVPALPKLELLPPDQRLFHIQDFKKEEHEKQDKTQRTPSPSPSHSFLRPAKRIHEGPDVSHFLVSQGYRDIGLFILQLNHAMCPRTTAQPPSLPTASTTTVFTLQTRRTDPPSVVHLRKLLDTVASYMDEAPPDPGPRRFGNASFRVWHRLLAERVDGLLAEYVLAVNGGKDHSERSEAKIEAKTEAKTKEDTTGRGEDQEHQQEATAMDELKAYFIGGFGSAQRLDYGTGHELSFLAFLGCLWKLGAFADGGHAVSSDESIERSLVLGVMEPYLRVVRKLILHYTLEPAGSHGVWGLDDHSFLPYIFGSAQLSRPLVAGAAAGAEGVATLTGTGTMNPQEGSAPRAPKPADVLKPATVEVQRELNLYFSAIGFIDDVKKGPFWEHSPILFDVSGIKEGWGKINKGMIKMYNAEVLSKFPVVQHFPFGSLFSWDIDPEAATPMQTIHMVNQPLAAAATAAGMKTGTPGGSSRSSSSSSDNHSGNPFGATGKPVSFPTSTGLPDPSASVGAPACQPATAAPWAQATRMPASSSGPGIPYSRVPPIAPTAAPLPQARTVRPGVPTGFPSTTNRAPPPPSAPSDTGAGGITKAPWAK